MPLFPLFADLAGRDVLVVGGGEVATRKIEALLHAGARVQVHAHVLGEALQQAWAEARITRLHGPFDPAWLDEAWLVIAATDDRAFNRELADEAACRRCLINVVDDAELSTFQVPAIIDRSPLQLAISSGGAAPMLARRLREQLEAQLDDTLGTLAGLFAMHRDEIRERLPDLPRRRQWFDDVIDGPVPALLRAGRSDAAAEAFLAALRDDEAGARAGAITLLGIGDGRPGSLTLDGLRALNQADLLVRDDAIPPAVMAMARRDASHASLPREEDARHQWLLEQARGGQRVVWLKPGNAFHEPPLEGLQHQLQAEGITCEVIAGVSSADTFRGEAEAN